MREAAGLKRAVIIAQQHHGPILAGGVLVIGVVTGVHDQRVIHHRAATFGNTLEFLHQLHQHATVVLADLNPDRVVRLLHVTKVMALLLHADSLP